MNEIYSTLKQAKTNGISGETGVDAVIDES